MGPVGQLDKSLPAVNLAGRMKNILDARYWMLVEGEKRNRVSRIENRLSPQGALVAFGDLISIISAYKTSFLL